jgi:error-prone DNA polymerase
MLERRTDGSAAIRLGLQLARELTGEAAAGVIMARTVAPFSDVRDLAERAGLGAKDLAALASAGALQGLASNRHQARWEVAGIERPMALLDRPRFAEALPLLRRPTECENIAADYRYLRVNLGRHPLALLRSRLSATQISSASDVAALQHGARVRAAGLVITRQRPSSASGVTFVTLEDETGYLNLVIWDKLAERARKVLLGAALLGVAGIVQKEGDVLHVIAKRLFDYTTLLGKLVTRSRDFH